MFSKAYSAAIFGIDAEVISVETDVADGLPIYDMVGYLSSEVREAKERVKIAMKNSGFRLPPKRVTINLSPADLRKEGTFFDLSIAISILTAFGFIPNNQLENTLFIGELSLDGSVLPVNGILPIVDAAAKHGIHRCIVPKKNEMEGAVIQAVEVFGVKTLRETVEFLTGQCYLEPAYINVDEMFRQTSQDMDVDFADISGQQSVKRAVEVAVSGLHNILLIGPPGSGKTMIARRVPSIMPDLTLEESMDITRIHSVSGELPPDVPLLLKRPFRSPHHTITSTALIGGGRNPKPGEVSLAHEGVLFLDELPEFNKHTIEILRQPLEDHFVTISRLNATYRYPASTMLLAAMNPCNCGYYPDRNRCSCTNGEVRNYLNKISQPLLDRIDITVEAAKIDYNDLSKKQKSETSETIRNRVRMAQTVQAKRYKDESFRFNSMLTPTKIKKYCKLDEPGKKLLKAAYETMNLSARAYHRILKVARTIADLDHSEDIHEQHLSEAICYRGLDKKYWGEF